MVPIGTDSNTEGPEINLDARGGSGTPESVHLTAEGKLPDNLSEPERAGWTFEGWYTKEPVEVFLSGGDETRDGVSVPNSDIKVEGNIVDTEDSDIDVSSDAQKPNTEEMIRDQLEAAGKSAGMTQDEIAAMIEALETQYKGLINLHNQWCTYTVEGTEVDEKTDLSDCDTIYAKYRPNKLEIQLHLNGWQNRTAALVLHRSTDSTVWVPNLSSSMYESFNWKGCEFKGWRSEDGDTVLQADDPEKTFVYVVGGETIPLPKKDGDIVEYFAIWEGQGVEEVTLRTDKIYHDKDEWKVVIYYSAKPSNANSLDADWGFSTDRDDIKVELEEYGDPREKKATLTVENDLKTIKDPVNVTVTVTVSGVKGSKTIQIGHSWRKGYSYPATCENAGYTSYECSDCHQKMNVNQQPIGHVFTTITVPPTCTTVGYEEWVCQKCGYTERRNETSATDHDFEFLEEKESGCGGTVRTERCKNCGFIRTTSTASDAKHVWNTYMTVDQKPTCTHEGSESIHCSRCGMVKEAEVIPATGIHNWGAWQVVTEAGVDKKGEQKRVCLDCETEEVQEIAAIVPDSAPESVEDNYSPAPTPSQPDYSDSSSDDDDDDSYSSGSGSSSGSAAASVPAGATLPAVPSAEVRESMPTYVEVGRWNQTADGSWTFRDETGEPCKNRWAALYNPYAHVAEGAEIYDWFRFDEAGNMITGWYVDPVDGNTYYMNTESDGTKGRMVTGWVVIDGKEYYFNTSSDGTKGRMYHNEMTPDGHFVGPDGVKIR